MFDKLKLKLGELDTLKDMLSNDVDASIVCSFL